VDFFMLTINECKKYLNPEIIEKLSDKDVLEIRDALYELAEIALETLNKENK
jgi:hypothetical protein